MVSVCIYYRILVEQIHSDLGRSSGDQHNKFHLVSFRRVAGTPPVESSNLFLHPLIHIVFYQLYPIGAWHHTKMIRGQLSTKSMQLWFSFVTKLIFNNLHPVVPKFFLVLCRINLQVLVQIKLTLINSPIWIWICYHITDKIRFMYHISITILKMKLLLVIPDPRYHFIHRN